MSRRRPRLSQSSGKETRFGNTWYREYLARRARLDQRDAAYSVPKQLEDSDKIGPTRETAKYRELSEKTKVRALIGQVTSLFSITHPNGVYQIGRMPGEDEIRKLAHELLDMWPKDFVSPAADENQFASLFWGHRTPNAVANCITRSSLYSERILIPNPFVDIMLHHPDFSPAIAPEKWTHPYAHQALFLAMLEPWVTADIVEVVTNPVCFNAKLFHQLASEALSAIDAAPALFEDFERMFGAEAMADMVYQMTEKEQKAFIAFAHKEDHGAARRLEHEVARLVASDPIRAKIPKDDANGVLLKSGSGMNYGQARLIAATRGAAILTNLPSHAFLLHRRAEDHASPFQQVTSGFSRSTLNFLNNVPFDFAVGLRKDGALARFRRYLLSVAKGIEVNAEESLSDDALKEFKDRFEDEYAAYKQEWRDIQTKLATVASAQGIARSVLTGAGLAFLSGNIEVGVITSFGAMATDATKSVVEAVFGRRALERRPLSLVLRLEKTTQR